MSLTPPELLRLAQVRVDDEGDEAVRVRLRLDQGAVEPELEVGVGPDLDDRVLLAGRGGAAAAAGDEIGAVEEYGLLVGEVVAAGDAPEAADVVAEPPGKEALDVRRGDADAALERVPVRVEVAARIGVLGVLRQRVAARRPLQALRGPRNVGRSLSEGNH